MSYQQHQDAAHPIIAQCAVVTVSDTRTERTDSSGASIRQLLADAGHAVVRYALCRDEPADLQPLLSDLIASNDVDVIITTGGTGISRRDQTIEVVGRLLDQPLPGFGELFRMLSWEQVGSGAMLSRAAAGIVRGKPIFALPGSARAVELAMTRLIIPELGHLLQQLRK